MGKRQVGPEQNQTAEPEAEAESAVNRERERAALTDYQKAVDDVLRVKAMTDTDAWKTFYVEIQKQIRRHSIDILDAEKPRDVVRHQEGVKILRGLIGSVREPVGKLNGYIASMPLFSAQMRTRAEWNDALGIVELTETPK